MKNMRSVYLEDKKYFEIEPNSILVNDMRERGIIPADISDDEICIVIWALVTGRCVGETKILHTPITRGLIL